MVNIFDCCVCQEPHLEIGWYRSPWGDIHVVCDDCRPKLVAHYKPYGGEEE